MSTPTNPNFILFMTDQQRGDCLSCDGHPVLLTPNMDNIAHQGTRFVRAYSTGSSCIPARRCLLSGKFPINNDMVGFQTTPWEPDTTLPRELQKAGYQTAIVGRNMHQYRPDSHYGFEYVAQDYGAYVASETTPGMGGSTSHGISSNGWGARPWHLPEHTHYTHWVMNEALEFLTNRDRDRPFFLVISFVAPHPPLVPPAFYMERYLRMDLPEPAIGDWEEPPPNNGIGLRPDSSRCVLTGERLRSCLAGYFGLINHVDDQIARVDNHSAVDWGNTVRIFTADHGEMLGDHYLFRKTFPFEGSARIPMLFGLPPAFGTESGQVRNEPVGLEDIMPTVLDLAGCTIPDGLDGRSLVPMLKGDGSCEWRPFLHGEHAACYSVEQSNHFITDGHHKFIWMTHSGQELLFDLDSDPGERHNLAADPAHAELTIFWRDRLIEHLKDRPEGFSDGTRLIAGRPHTPVPPGKEQ